MKFRLKITLCMLCLLSLLFGIGGSALISISFQNSLEREREAAHLTYQMLLNTLSVINRIEALRDADDISAVLSQLLSQRAASWSALRISTPARTFYESGSSEQLEDLNFDEIIPEYCFVSSRFAPDGRHYLQLSGAFVLGSETLYLDALQDVSSVYEMRSQQQDSYRKIYLWLIVACAMLTYSISWLLTRPLIKLVRASKEIARGNLSCRSAVRTSDEIGDLSTEFDRMAAQTEKSVEKLKDAMARQERFTRSFTHELKTPMASIIGYADLLRLQTLTPDEQAEAANYIFTAGKRLENLSVRLLDLFVMDKQEPQFRETSLKSLVEKVVVSVRALLVEKQIEIFAKCGSGNCYLEPDLIWSLLVNLIDNAAKALPQGGKIGIVTEITENGCRIRVIDNGCGIPKSAMEHITEPFYRADRFRADERKGAGLGLALCAKIVELHNGSMAFESNVGEGTRVTVELKGGRA